MLFRYLGGCFFIISFLFISCNKTELLDDSFHATDNFNRSIKFTVKHVYNFTPIMDSVVAGAVIDIYDNLEDLQLDYYPDATRITDSLGECEISGLDQDKFYIRATHPSFANIVDSVSTPENTTSFVEIIFY